MGIFAVTIGIHCDGAHCHEQVEAAEGHTDAETLCLCLDWSREPTRLLPLTDEHYYYYCPTCTKKRRDDGKEG